MSINPQALLICPDPVTHSGQSRLQRLVSSTLMNIGIPGFNALPERELKRKEYPVTRVFNVLIGFTCIDKYNIKK
jgi:hypothetical protein